MFQSPGKAGCDSMPELRPLSVRPLRLRAWRRTFLPYMPGGWACEPQDQKPGEPAHALRQHRADIGDCSDTDNLLHLIYGTDGALCGDPQLECASQHCSSHAGTI